MHYKLYKLKFQGAVHFGRQKPDEGEYTCYADTIFSALCQEALQMGGTQMVENLCSMTKEGEWLLSDAFPYIGDTYYLPKPMKRIESDREGDSIIKKAYKKLKYIPMDMMDIYLQGKYDVLNAQDFSHFGHFEMRNMAAVRGETETMPYRIGTYYYEEGNGLYVIVGYKKQETLELVEELFNRLSLSGIGGKRASGLGRFELFQEQLPGVFCERLEKEGAGYMSLSVALPRQEELETVLAGADYLLCKRSGFVASEKYAPEQMRKRDLYVFKAGSCFSQRFCGDIYDVSDKVGRHPVYRYAKPLLMEV